MMCTYVAITGLDDHDLNEHLCLSAARQAGLTAATSAVQAFEAERVIVVERYDRFRRPDGTVARIHQEDMCQATGTDPSGKYQNEGGPSPERIIELLRSAVRPAAAAERDILRFVDALALNWLIAGTDAHAKNYSLLLSGDQARLSPLYDVASALPYNDMHLPKLRMAMKIGGEYRIEAVSGRHWRRFAEANQLDPKATVDQVDSLASRLPEAFRRAAMMPGIAELDSTLPARLTELVGRRARSCREELKR